MTVTLPKAPPVYSQLEEQQFRGRLESILSGLFGSGSDMRVKKIRITLTSPNGTEYAINIDDTGAITTASYP